MTNFVKVWTIKTGDTLPEIAGRVYGDPKRWRPIADANHIHNPLLFPDKDKDFGRVLFIPGLRS